MGDDWAAMQNFSLLHNLSVELDANGFGHNERFFAVGPDWQCPSCLRSKDEIARLDKNGNLLCRIVSHHDHFNEFGFKEVEKYDVKPIDSEISKLRSSLREIVRFPDILICEDCNIADGTAKRMIRAHSQFSFAPHEIGLFIKAVPNNPHEIDADIARNIYQAAAPTLRLMCKRVQDLTAAEMQKIEREPIPLGGAVAQILPREERRG